MRPASSHTVLLGEPLAMVREGVAALLGSFPSLRVVAQCADGLAAIELARQHQPALAVLDAHLPGIYTPEVALRFREERLPTQMVLLTARLDRPLLLSALRCGVRGVVWKASSGDQLHEACGKVLDGGMYVSPMFGPGPDEARPVRMSDPDRLSRLSHREYEVFRMLVDGIRAKEIASRLALSPKTVDSHRASLMRKLDIYDLPGLVKYAIARSEA